MTRGEGKRPTIIRRWAIFFSILLQPDVLLLILTAIVLYYVSTVQSNPLVNVTITTIVSLISGITGGVISKKLDEINEGWILMTRGRSAIRSLKLLLLNISSMNKRIETYIELLDKNNQDSELIESNFKEIIDRCLRLQEQTLNSIEDWTDIIPEANVVSQIGVITNLQEKIAIDQVEIHELQERISKAEVKSMEKDTLEKQLVDKEEEIRKTKEQLSDMERRINSSVLSGIAIVPTSGSGPFKTYRIMPGSGFNLQVSSVKPKVDSSEDQQTVD